MNLFSRRGFLATFLSSLFAGLGSKPTPPVAVVPPAAPPLPPTQAPTSEMYFSTYLGGTVTTTVYDSAGRLVKVLNSTVQTTTFVYDGRCDRSIPPQSLDPGPTLGPVTAVVADSKDSLDSDKQG